MGIVCKLGVVLFGRCVSDGQEEREREREKEEEEGEEEQL